jgi:aspartate carbamoyltransferase catalytic subunit
MWNDKHLISLGKTDATEARVLLSSAHADTYECGILAGKSVANLFFEDSTRTRLSFSLAAQRLGASVVDLTGKGSSLSKGESLLDTAWTIEAMGVDAIVIRSSQSGASDLIARNVKVPIINAGDGTHQHPTQALADALTIGQSMNRTDGWDFRGLKIAIVGDVVTSRVARSNVCLLQTLGAQVTLVGPSMMTPKSFEAMGCKVTHDLDKVVCESDVIMMLRIQFERGGGAVLASKRSYHHEFGLTAQRAEQMKPDAIVMHPGPMNRGVEIAGDVADGNRSVILNQVTNGVQIRKAVLHHAMIG